MTMNIVGFDYDEVGDNLLQLSIASVYGLQLLFLKINYLFKKYHKKKLLMKTQNFCEVRLRYSTLHRGRGHVLMKPY